MGFMVFLMALGEANLTVYMTMTWHYITKAAFGRLVIGFVGRPFFPPFDIDLFLIFFWAGFAPSIWLWLYVIALFVTRGLLRSEKLLNWLRWALDVEKNPFRSIGAVAATLAFIASVAIILLSAEVSRISAA